MMTLAFNTNRTYTEHGQRLAFGVLDDGSIAMVDVDRGISGMLSRSVADDNNLDLDATVLLWAYDNNLFTQYLGFGRDDQAREVLEAVAVGGACALPQPKWHDDVSYLRAQGDTLTPDDVAWEESLHGACSVPRAVDGAVDPYQRVFGIGGNASIDKQDGTSRLAAVRSDEAWI